MKISNHEVPEDLFLLYMHSMISKDAQREALVIKHIHNYLSTYQISVDIEELQLEIRKLAEETITNPNFDKSKAMKDILK